MIYPAPAVPTSRLRRALGDAWRVNWRCAVMLSVITTVPFVLISAFNGNGIDGGALGALVAGVHLLAVAVVGFPLGVVVSWRLDANVSRTRASAWFALVGATAGGLMMCWAGALPIVGWAVLGGVVAGSARAWAHTAIRASHELP